MFQYILKCDANTIGVCSKGRKETEDCWGPQVHKAPKEKLVHVLPPVRVPRVHQVYKAPLDQPEAGACLV